MEIPKKEKKIRLRTSQLFLTYPKCKAPPQYVKLFMDDLFADMGMVI